MWKFKTLDGQSVWSAKTVLFDSVPRLVIKQTAFIGEVAKQVSLMSQPAVIAMTIVKFFFDSFMGDLM